MIVIFDIFGEVRYSVSYGSEHYGLAQAHALVNVVASKFFATDGGVQWWKNTVVNFVRNSSFGAFFTLFDLC